MRNINPDQLLALVTVVDQGGFTSAARTLNLTQPAVSLQIRELENRCGVPLLVRQSRKPRLTEAGDALIDRARRILAEHESALAAMRRFQDRAAGHVRLGLTPATLTYFAGPAIRSLKTSHPTLQLSITVQLSGDLGQMVRDNALDIAVAAMPIETTDLKADVVLDDDLVAILPDDVIDLPRVATPGFLAEQSLVSEPRYANLRAMISDWFAAERLEPQRHLQLETLEAIKSAVAAGLGAAIVPHLIVRSPPPGIKILPLKPTLKRPLVMVQRKDRKTDGALGLVRSALTEAGRNKKAVD